MNQNKSTGIETSFDEKAVTWDEKPERLDLAKAIAGAVSNQVGLSRNMSAFEYGCGTGLLGFLLASQVGSLVMADTSSGMLAVADEKIGKAGAGNIKTMCLDLSGEEGTDLKFDLVFTQMAFHHITNYLVVAERLFGMLNPGGWICIADLEPEDGSFHDEDSDVHNGIDPERLDRLIRGLGGIHGRIVRAHSIPKNGREYAVFLYTAQKGA